MLPSPEFLIAVTYFHLHAYFDWIFKSSWCIFVGREASSAKEAQLPLLPSDLFRLAQPPPPTGLTHKAHNTWKFRHICWFQVCLPVGRSFIFLSLRLAQPHARHTPSPTQLIARVIDAFGIPKEL